MFRLKIVTLATIAVILSVSFSSFFAIAANKPIFTKYNLDESLFVACKSRLLPAFDLIPASHLRQLKQIILHENSHWRRGMATSDTIYLSCLPNAKEMQAVFVHEMGHIVDVGLMEPTNSVKRTPYSIEHFPVFSGDRSISFYSINWLGYQKFVGSSSTDDFVSGYAQANHFEDFAESYAYYLLHGDKFRLRSQKNFRLARKYFYLKFYVFSGSEFQLNKIPGNYTLTNSVNPLQYSLEYDVTKLSY